jgi:hypothetical protein
MHNPRKPLRIAAAAMFAASTAGVMAATVTKSDTSTMQVHAPIGLRDRKSVV